MWELRYNILQFVRCSRRECCSIAPPVKADWAAIHSLGSRLVIFLDYCPGTHHPNRAKFGPKAVIIAQPFQPIFIFPLRKYVTPAPTGGRVLSRFPTYAPHAPSALLLPCNPVFRIYDAVCPSFFKQVSRLAPLHKHSFRRCRMRLAPFTSTRQQSSAGLPRSPFSFLCS